MVAIILSILLSQNSMAQSTPLGEVFGNMSENMNIESRTELTKVYADFIVNDFVSSNYCQEGWGDDDGAIRMQRACKLAQADMLKELKRGDGLWMDSYTLENALVFKDKIDFRFSKILKLSTDAPLSCILSIEFSINPTNRQAVDSAADLYCDH